MFALRADFGHCHRRVGCSSITTGAEDVTDLSARLNQPGYRSSGVNLKVFGMGGHAQYRAGELINIIHVTLSLAILYSSNLTSTPNRASTANAARPNRN